MNDVLISVHNIPQPLPKPPCRQAPSQTPPLRCLNYRACGVQRCLLNRSVHLPPPMTILLESNYWFTNVCNWPACWRVSSVCASATSGPIDNEVLITFSLLTTRRANIVQDHDLMISEHSTRSKSVSINGVITTSGLLPPWPYFPKDAFDFITLTDGNQSVHNEIISTHGLLPQRRTNFRQDHELISHTRSKSVSKQ